jgi:hypothetical protein
MCSQPLGFLPCTVLLLTDNSGSRVPSNGSNQLASRVPKKEMVKGKRPNKEPPQESPNAQQSPDVTGGVQVLPPKKKKEKSSSAHSALPATPSHPPLSRTPPFLAEHRSPFSKGVLPGKKQRRIGKVKKRMKHHPNLHRKQSWTRL